MVPVVSQRIFLGLTCQALSPACKNWPIWFSPIKMSIASIVTTSVEIDPTRGKDTEIVNQICILVGIWGNGTPLHPTSFGEEDVITLCLGLGQEHLEGMLWLSDTETVLAFLSGSDIMATLCHFAAAMVWHGEPVKLCIQPPQLCR